MEKIITKDKSITYYNEEYNEQYHSISGAKEESNKKFVLPCEDIIKTSTDLVVLDICFGLGYNSAAFIDYMFKNYPNKKFKIIGLENDLEILKKIKENNESGFENYDCIKDKKNIKIILGNALETIKQLNEKFDIVFFDPFSPKKCPELWGLDFINYIFSLMKKKSILTTYSCARIVRDNLKEVGFIVKDGPSVGRRAPSTIAMRN